MIIVYSGTGNSLYVAKMLAEMTGDELYDVYDDLKAERPGQFNSNRPYVFVSPTYAWQVPRILQDYIRASTFQGAKEAYFVLTCGSGVGNAGHFARALAEEKDFRYQGLGAVVMPENYIAVFWAPSEEKSRAIISKAESMIRRYGELIRREEPFSQKGRGLFGGMKSDVVNRFFYRFIVKADKFYAKDNCVSCGLCERLCPLNNIHLVQGRPQWGKDCTHCMACIGACPVEAIEYGKRTQGMRRYYMKK